MTLPSEVDTATFEGLTRLFRFAIRLRDNDADSAALARLERRFNLPAYEPRLRGGLEDFAQHLDGLGHEQRFSAVCGLIAGVLEETDKLDSQLVNELLEIGNNNRIVRFSFAPSLLPCLMHAQSNSRPNRGPSTGCEIRYAGLGSDKELMAFASLFLDLPIYTESNAPWEPDQVFDDGEPNSEQPDLEISFPPGDFHSIAAPHLEASVRRSRLPRSVDHGKYDIESVMLSYLCESERPAFAFTSEAFLMSTKQSRLLTRQRLVELGRIRHVSALKTAHSHRFLIELGQAGDCEKTIRFSEEQAVQGFTQTSLAEGHSHRQSALISTDAIRSGGYSLKPARYNGSGPLGGQKPAEVLRNALSPSKFRLADLFDIVRPKTTKNDPVGTFCVSEVRAGNISENGEVLGPRRHINIRAALENGLEEQIIKPGDILFAHRGPIGRVAYVTVAEVQENKTWAGQTLLILRARKSTSVELIEKYCDPRVLFMYLLAPKVRASWIELANGDRSPAIPIGEIERFSLPEGILHARRPRKSVSEAGSNEPRSDTDLILAEFHDRQEKLIALREIQEAMDDGLARAWTAAWRKGA